MEIVLKPVKGSGGRGIIFLDKKNAEKVFSEYKFPYGNVALEQRLKVVHLEPVWSLQIDVADDGTGFHLKC